MPPSAAEDRDGDKPGTPPDRLMQIWPTCFLTFAGVIELIAVILLFLTELGNVAANFWTVNVFAGGWCGLIMLIHMITLFAASCCSPTRKSASRAVILSILGLIASAALISFDAAFLVRPDTCILTPSCAANSVSTTVFSYDFQQSFYRTFRSMDFFKTYTDAQTKYFFQAVQVGVGAVCFLICLIYLIVYFVHVKKAEERVQPKEQPPYRRRQEEPDRFTPSPPPPPSAPPLNYRPRPIGQYPPMAQYPQYPPMPQYPPGPRYPPMMPQGYYPPQGFQQVQPVWRQAPPRMPQAPPGQIPWDGAERY